MIGSGNNKDCEEWFFDRLWITIECGRLQVSPGEIVVLPLGFCFAVNLPDVAHHAVVLQRFLAPIFNFLISGQYIHNVIAFDDRANGLAAPRDFLVPTAWFEESSCPGYTIVQKFGGELFISKQDFSPLNMVAWHGNYAPFKFCPHQQINLAWHCLISSSSFHGGWLLNILSDLHITIGICMSEFMGLIYGGYEAKADGFLPGGASLHSCMTPHGLDMKTYEATIARGNEAGPQRIADTMAFMFESCLIPRVYPWALESPLMDDDYYQCRIVLKSHFTCDATDGQLSDIWNGHDESGTEGHRE